MSNQQRTLCCSTRLTEAARKLGALRFEGDGDPGGAAGADSGARAFAVLQEQLDRRFLELAEMVAHGGERPIERAIEYSVPLAIRLEAKVRTIPLVISPTTSLQSALDALFGSIAGHVPPYTYLYAWVLVRVDGSVRDVRRLPRSRNPRFHSSISLRTFASSSRNATSSRPRSSSRCAEPRSLAPIRQSARASPDRSCTRRGAMESAFRLRTEEWTHTVGCR